VLLLRYARVAGHVLRMSKREEDVITTSYWLRFFLGRITPTCNTRSMLDKQLTGRMAVGLQLVRTCDELNNLLAAAMLKGGLLQLRPEDKTSEEIELLSLRARTAVDWWTRYRLLRIRCWNRNGSKHNKTLSAFQPRRIGVP
jgi:hypothetical protein